VYRVAGGLPSPDREALQSLARKYAEAAVSREWPAMQSQQDDRPTAELGQEMWQRITTINPNAGPDVTRLDHIMQSLRNLMERRSLREEEREIRLPTVLWVLLVVGGGVTIASAAILGNDNKWLHYFQVLVLTFVVSVALAAIADLARPFEGSVSVSPAAFERVLATMQQPSR
jgi:Protein of unknown function (DUF4239)